MADGTPINRVLVKADVFALTPLAVRTGAQEAAETPNDDAGSGKPLAIDLDILGRPMIPASSFRGVFRAFLGTSGGPVADMLFGHGPRAAEKETNGQTRQVQVARGGKLEFVNLMSSDKDPRFETFCQTAIDNATRTAGDAMLRASRLAAAGTRFSLEITADSLTGAEIEFLAAALLAFAAEPRQVGASASTGAGLIELQDLQLFAMDETAIAAWLSEPDIPSWRDYIRKYPVDMAALAGAIPGLIAPTDEDDIRIDLVLDFDAPFLVATTDTAGQADLAPFEFSISHSDLRSVVRLPGSSMKGAWRAQASRILNTLGLGAEDAEAMFLAPLFGDVGQRGALEFHHFKVDDGAFEDRIQEFVAIDRITGGARSGAKFNVRRPDSLRLKGGMRLRRDRLVANFGDTENGRDHAQACIGLLALVARDFGEGDMPLGFGSRKGFGVPTVDLAASVMELGVAGSQSAWLPEQMQGPLASVLELAEVKAFLDGAVAELRRQLQRAAAE